MNITYLIGNGFDLNLGLKTRYYDFYKQYIKNEVNDNEHKAIRDFKREISDFIKRETNTDDEQAIDWRDFEVALGKWTERLEPSDVEPLYLSIIDSLRDYLINEFRFFDALAFSSDDFKHYLVNPVSDFFPRERANDILKYWRNHSGPDELYIINFNYTHTIEQLLEVGRRGISLGVDCAGHSMTLRHIYHVHQSLGDEEIIVGVNDVSQISNKEFHQDRNVCNLLIKQSTNTLLGNGLNQDCEQLINNTDLFVIFGSSIGITDKKWWRLICERIYNGGARLLLFVHLSQAITHMGLMYEKMKAVVVRDFLDSAGCKEEIPLDRILPKIYVCFRSGLFHLTPDYNDRIPDSQKYAIGSSAVEIKVVRKAMNYIAVSVEAPDEASGIQAEKQWIKEFFPYLSEVSQRIDYYEVDGRKLPFDTILLESRDLRKSIFFEISSFFGKFSDNKGIILMDKRMSSFLKTIERIVD